MSTTTIQVEHPTKEILNELKKSFHSRTYDEVIQNLVKRKMKSMYGKFSKGGKISKSEMMKGLRDKSDRF